jgi:hypothetical protein
VSGIADDAIGGAQVAEKQEAMSISTHQRPNPA